MLAKVCQLLTAIVIFIRREPLDRLDVPFICPLITRLKSPTNDNPLLAEAAKSVVTWLTESQILGVWRGNDRVKTNAREIQVSACRWDIRQLKELNKRKHRIVRKTKLVSAGSIWPLWSPFLKSSVTIARSLAGSAV